MSAYRRKTRRNRMQGGRSGASGRCTAFLLAVIFFLVTVLSGCSSSSQEAASGESSTPSSSHAAAADDVSSNSADDTAPDDVSSQSAGETAASGDSSQQSAGEEAASGAPAASSEKTLTLMLYLCGSDLESKTGAATKDMEEIVASGVNTDEVNVIVLAGGTTKWQNGFSHEETAVYELIPAASTESAEEQRWKKAKTFSSPKSENAPANMGEEDTLKEFLNYSHEQYPAEKYALIMWNHGGGPMRGLCWDTAWAKDNLSMKEFTGALESSPFAQEKLSWIGFDACLMSSIETAHLVTPYAEYMIASEETEPCVGWSYEFLTGIENDSDGKETGTRIVDSFIAAGEAANRADDKDSALTLSCMDLSKTGNVEEKLDVFFGKLRESLSPETFSRLSNMREATREFGKAMNDSQRYDLVDLGDLVANYADQAPEEAAELTEALQDMVTYSKSSLENCSGLSAYHPYYNKTYYEKLWRDEYDAFSFAPNYTDYINNFATIWLGEAMGDWTQVNQLQSAGIEGQTQYFSVQLTPQQLQYYASSELLILTQPYSGEYSQVFKTNQVTVDENGVLTAGYNGRTLYAVDEDGTIVTGPLKYYISDDGNLEIFLMYENFETGAEQLFTHVIYECADAPAGTNLPVLEQYVYDEEMDTWSNRLELREEDYQYLHFSHLLKHPVYDGDQIRPYSAWEDSGNVFSYEIPLTEGIHFRFYDHILDDSSLYACFEITDTQANMYGTELMEVENPNLTAIRFEGGTRDTTGTSGSDGGEKYTLENDYLRMTVTGYLDNSELSKSLDLKCAIENISDKALNVDLANGVKLSDSSRTCICIPSESTTALSNFAPGASEECTIELDDRLLTGLSNLTEISFALACEEYTAQENEGENDAGNTGDAENAEGTSPAEAGAADGTSTADNTSTAAGENASGAETAAEDTANGTSPAETGAADGTSTADSTSAAAGGNADGAETTAEDTAGKTQDMGLNLVLHPIGLDLSEISGYKEYSKNPGGIAACTDGTLHWTLHSAEVQRDGSVEFAMTCKNEGTAPVIMNPPCEIAINDTMLRTDTYPFLKDVEQISVGPGEEFSMVSTAENVQYYGGDYRNLSGWHHLTISDALGIEGEEEIRTVSLFTQYDFLFSFQIPEANNQNTPVTFTLAEPISLDRSAAEKVMDASDEYMKTEEESQTETAANQEAGSQTGDGTNQEAESQTGDGTNQGTGSGTETDTESSAEPGSETSAGSGETADAKSETDQSNKKPTREEMTKALDADGAAPLRTKLVSKDGVSVYGEHILIADETILMSFIIENLSYENAIIQFGGWKIGTPESETEMNDIGYAYIAFASTTKRIYLELTDFDQMLNASQDSGAAEAKDPAENQAEDTAIKDLTLSFWKIGSDYGAEIPTFYQTVFHFPDGSAYNVEGGISVTAEETDPTVSRMNDQTGSTEFFEKTVSYPENPAQYRKDYTFTLPKSPAGDKDHQVNQVYLALYRDYYPELQPDEQTGLMDQLAASGVQDQTPVCMQFLSHVPMTPKTAGLDTYTASWSGLVCVPEANPEYYYCTQETPNSSGETVFSFNYSGFVSAFSLWGLKPREPSYSSYLYPRYFFNITAGEDYANLTQMTIENANNIAFSAWPPILYDSMVFVYSVPAFYRNPDNPDSYLAMNLVVNRGIGEEFKIPLNGTPQTLRLMPAEEYKPDIKAVYIVFYQDGTFDMYDAK